MKVSKKKGYWYFVEHTECCACSRILSHYRIRMPGKKPKEMIDRYSYRQGLCNTCWAASY